jgi:hypothetical protein
VSEHPADGARCLVQRVPEQHQVRTARPLRGELMSNPAHGLVRSCSKSSPRPHRRTDPIAPVARSRPPIFSAREQVNEASRVPFAHRQSHDSPRKTGPTPLVSSIQRATSALTHAFGCARRHAEATSPHPSISPPVNLTTRRLRHIDPSSSTAPGCTAAFPSEAQASGPLARSVPRNGIGRSQGDGVQPATQRRRMVMWEA